jgi:hypothetical protein
MPKAVLIFRPGFSQLPDIHIKAAKFAAISQDDPATGPR